MNAPCLDLDLHRLDLRFAGARVAEPRAVEWIARSIESGGPLVPCIVVAEPVEVSDCGVRLLLIDGYRRIAALRRLGRDTANASSVGGSPTISSSGQIKYHPAHQQIFSTEAGQTRIRIATHAKFSLPTRPMPREVASCS